MYNANFCPITQGLPYYIRQAFPEIPDERVLSPVVSFKYGEEKALEPFILLGETLGSDEKEVRAAFAAALVKQREYAEKAASLGREALAEARRSKRPVIALLGRPYNAFTPDANMGIPRKFTSRGCTIIPFDILPFENEDIFANMYWYYGQQDMKASRLVKNEDNVFVTYITNFSCAPDSFMLHYLKWNMGTKPFLVLELDSHSADAGVDTRVEAFLDIIEGYRSKFTEIASERFDNGLRFLVEKDGLYVKRLSTCEKMPLRGNPRIRAPPAKMGLLSTELLAASLRSAGISARPCRLADTPTLQLARNHASGKECLPPTWCSARRCALRLGAVPQGRDIPALRPRRPPVPAVPGSISSSTRTLQGPAPGQRGGHHARFRQLVQRAGSDFSKHAWWGLVISDYMKDVETSCGPARRIPLRR